MSTPCVSRSPIAGRKGWWWSRRPLSTLPEAEDVKELKWMGQMGQVHPIFPLHQMGWLLRRPRIHPRDRMSMNVTDISPSPNLSIFSCWSGERILCPRHLILAHSGISFLRWTIGDQSNLIVPVELAILGYEFQSMSPFPQFHIIVVCYHMLSFESFPSFIQEHETIWTMSGIIHRPPFLMMKCGGDHPMMPWNLG